MNQKTKKDLINYRRERAFETIKEVDLLISKDMFFAAVNRIYYGMFYIINALSVLDNFSTSSHSQLIGYFNKNYLKTNKIDRKIGKYFSKAFEKRSKGDYKDFVSIEKEEIDEYFGKMKELIKIVDNLITDKLKNI